MLIFSNSGFESVFSVRIFATYFAGSQYITWLSFNPVFANIAAAAAVRHSVNHAAVQQAQPVRAEIHRNRDSIAAVAIEEQWGGAIARRIAAINDGERHARSVGRGGMQSLTDVWRSIVAAENRLL